MAPANRPPPPPPYLRRYLDRGRRLCRNPRPLVAGLLVGLGFAVAAIVVTAL